LARLAFIGDVRVRRKWLLKGLKWSAVYSLNKNKNEGQFWNLKTMVS
jgi:hypothetical protein